LAHTHASRRAMMGNRRFKAGRLGGNGAARKRGHYGGGVGKPAQRVRGR
jgi:hypothetical protein